MKKGNEQSLKVDISLPAVGLNPVMNVPLSPNAFHLL